MSTQAIAGGPARNFSLSMRARERILGIASPILLLAVWELAARFHFIDTRFFPAPSSVIAVMIEMLRSGELVTNTLVSLRRLALGTLIGIYLFPGIAVALPGGVFGHRYGDKTIACVGLAAMTMGGQLMAQAEGTTLLMIGRVLWDEFFSNRAWPVASAVAILLLLLLVPFMMWYQSVQARESAGAR